MTKRMTRIGVGLGAAVLTLTVGASVFGAGQGPGGRGGPGGPGRIGGPFDGAQGRPGRGGPMGGPAGPLGGLPIAQLGLTDAQQAQVRSIIESHQAEMKTLGDRAMTAREGLHAATTSGTLDEGLIRTHAAEVAAVESDIAVAHARNYSEVFQILTPDQQAKARQFATDYRLSSRGQPPALRR